MSIKISNIEVCETCNNRTCTYCDSIVKEKYHSLRSETTVCPVALLQDGPLDLAKNGIIDNGKCINCGLCVLNCLYFNNIICIIDDYRKNDFENLTEQQYNAIACSYLHSIIGFAANTNRNKSLQFDGYVSNSAGQEAFVEVDYNNDSLESVRRILADRLLYSPSDREIKNGVIVLKNMPKKGCHDVHYLLEKIAMFPHSNDMRMYFTTFQILRLIALNIRDCKLKLDEAFFDIANETEEQYIYRISKFIKNEKIISQLQALVSIT